MGEFDPEFIQAVEHRPKTIPVEADGIPVIDLSSISTLDHIPNNNNSKEILGGLISEIGEACEKWGFFQVINHGVAPEKLENMDRVTREFFALPLEEKRKVKGDVSNPMGYYDVERTKNVRDWKQVFDFTVRDRILLPVSPGEIQTKTIPSRWPEQPSEFREVAQEYARELEKLAFKLVELISLSLELEANRLNGFFDDHTSYVRLNHYPECPIPHLALGIGRHKDSGAITILAQDSVGGLEVKRKSDGEWVRVKPTPGAFIINVGAVFQVWSNDKYESVEHRAVVNTEKDRLSIPFFFHPSRTVMVKPLEELINEQNLAKYRAYNWGEFLAIRKINNFKKLEGENIQVTHFKITE